MNSINIIYYYIRLCYLKGLQAIANIFQNQLFGSYSYFQLKRFIIKHHLSSELLATSLTYF